MYYTSILIALVGSVIYHTSMKSIPKELNPFFGLAVIYFLAFIISIVAMFCWPDGSRRISDLQFGVGGVALGVLGIEMGFLLAYRAGWHVGYTALMVNVLSVLILLPIAIVFMKQGVTILKLAGIVLSVAGLAMLMKH